MPEKVISQEDKLAALDADLDSKYATVFNPTAEQPKEVAPVAEVPEEETEEVVEEEAVEEEATGEEEKESKPTGEETYSAAKEEKQAYAFEKLRKEANNYKQKAGEFEELLLEIDNLALASGFQNREDFIEKFRQSVVMKEAKTRNIDPSVMKELNDTKQRLAKIEQEKNNQEKNSKISTLGNEVKNFEKELQLSETQMTGILQEMEKDGYTVDSLVTLPINSVNRLLKSYAVDILAEREYQKRLSKDNGKPDMQEGKFKNKATKKPSVDPFSSDALKDELEAYEKEIAPWKFKK
jgi:hypothetical protein